MEDDVQQTQFDRRSKMTFSELNITKDGRQRLANSIPLKMKDDVR
uniref:Uncharacterized protein n=1 Tax=Cucumis melo TaxID=3656 RepID=A0A9I9EJB3_CUCME